MLGHRLYLRIPKFSINLLISIFLANVLGACSSFTPAINAESQMQPPVISETKTTKNTRDKTDNREATDSATGGSRSIAAVAQGTRVITKFSIIDPIIRPVTYVKAFYGLTLKTIGGMLERTAINQFNFPALESKLIPPVSGAPPMDLEAWELELGDLIKTRPSLGKVRFLVDGNEYFPRLKQAIKDAEFKVDIRTYIFDNDDVGVEIANALKEKSFEVKIKVLVDGFGDLIATNIDSDTMPVNFNLPSSITSYLEDESKVKVRVQSNPWFTGDHVKTTIIDENLAFVGGMNIGRENRYEWHDLMMEVKGPVVKQLQFEFDKTWARAGWGGDFALFFRMLRGYKRDPDKSGYPIRILKTAIHNSELYRAQIAAIRRASNRIYIQNAYFSDDAILYELAKARRRGVDVRVIISSDAQIDAINLSNEATINTMLRNGIRVYSYPGMTHLKAAIYDGWACLGSANFDKLSLQVNQEINLGISHPETVQSLVDRVFIPDFAASRELYEPIPLRWTHGFAELFADELL